MLDYLDKASAQVVAKRLTPHAEAERGRASASSRRSRPPTKDYTRYLIVNDTTLKHRVAPGSRARQQVFANRDINRLFEGLSVSDSFLLLTKTRENRLPQARGEGRRRRVDAHADAVSRGVRAASPSCRVRLAHAPCWRSSPTSAPAIPTSAR